MSRKCIQRIFCTMCCLMLVLAPMMSALSETDDRTIYRVGDNGVAIRDAQQRLKELDYYNGSADGVFTQALSDAILLFQQHNGLLETGELDASTRAALALPNAVACPDTAHRYEQTMAEADGGAGQVDRSNWSFSDGSASAALVSVSGVAYDSAMEFSANEYGFFQENGFVNTLTSPLSTFAADVDTASYAQFRSMLLSGEDIPIDAVRIEEMLNYFHYDYPQPEADEPFGVSMEVTDCPWNAETKLLLIGLQAEEIPAEERPQQNLVFLIDVSGSMNEANKLPLVKRAFMLLLDQLKPTDTISMVTYASRDAVILDGTPASNKVEIMEAINSLTAGGATAGAAGIQTAYELAQKHFIKGGTNRILLATDGDLNVGVSGEGALARLVSEKKENGVFLSVLGFGYGNYKDNKLEAIADYGNGNYHYIDTIFEARKALIDEIGSTFLTVAKDVKLQLDFNPSALKGYRLIGYENRVMAAEDFANDQKDGGEIGSGHRVTALYELATIDSGFTIEGTSSKYQAAPENNSAEWFTLSIRSKMPDSDESTLYSIELPAPTAFAPMSDNMRFAAAVAETGMLLRESEWSGSASYTDALALLRGCNSVMGDPYKEEFLYLVTLLERAQ